MAVEEETYQSLLASTIVPDNTTFLSSSLPDPRPSYSARVSRNEHFAGLRQSFGQTQHSTPKLQVSQQITPTPSFLKDKTLRITDEDIKNYLKSHQHPEALEAFTKECAARKGNNASESQASATPLKTDKPEERLEQNHSETAKIRSLKSRIDSLERERDYLRFEIKNRIMEERRILDKKYNKVINGLRQRLRETGIEDGPNGGRLLRWGVYSPSLQRRLNKRN